MTAAVFEPLAICARASCAIELTWMDRATLAEASAAAARACFPGWLAR